MARSFSHSTNRSLSACMCQAVWQVLGNTPPRIGQSGFTCWGGNKKQCVRQRRMPQSKSEKWRNGLRGMGLAISDRAGRGCPELRGGEAGSGH